MTVYEKAITKIRELPEPLIEEVNDFIDFLQMKQDSSRWQLWLLFKEVLEITESDFSNYLSNPEDYENRLARGEESDWKRITHEAFLSGYSEKDAPYDKL